MGVDLCAFSGYADSGTAEVYGPGGLIASIPFSVAGGASVSFFGYEDVGGITRVRFTSSVYSWSPILNDHTYGGSLATQSVSGTLTYTGAGTGPISIAAFDGEGCGDGDYTEVWIPGPGPYTLDLSPGAYYICACRDTNQNGSCPDPGEPASGYDGNPVTVSAEPVTGINISLQGQPQRVESVPTMTEWGMIIFIALAGVGSVYYLRRQRRA
jgi:hypothetical protein